MTEHRTEKNHVEQRSRHTIMDGKVLMFATSFEDRQGAFGETADARGPFEVSASRNAVVVHHADLHSDEAVAAFLKAIELARHAAQRLAREDKGNYRG